ncbi:MAG: hypothetical protein IH945_01480 [Armatimonadetes bacterium]|nr:hypothetical protein [Armatimonadota bacterium]
MKGIALALMALAVLTGGGTPALAQRMLQKTDVCESTSQSGEWHIKVIPSHRYGSGPAKYRLRKSGEVVWERDMPVTLVEVWIADNGIFGGYGYTFGYEGFGPGDKQGKGDMVFMVVSPEGKVQSQKSFPRAYTGMLHTPPAPTVSDSLFIGHTSQIVLRSWAMADDGVWIIDLADGEVRRAEAPDDGEFQGTNRFIIFSENIGGTPLVLTQWYEVTGNYEIGTRFVIAPAEGDKVWEMHWPYDYSGSRDDSAVSDELDGIRSDGAVTNLSGRRFSVRSLKNREETEFEVSESAPWTVTEVGRERYVQPEPAAGAPHVDWKSAPKRTVTVSSSFNPVTVEPHEIAGAFEFEPTAEGNFAVLKNTAEWSGIIEVDRSGNVVRKFETKFAPEPGYRSLSFCHVAESTYIVTTREADSKRCSIYRVDVDTRAIRHLADLQEMSIEGVAATQDRIVVFGSLHQRYSLPEMLTVFDGDGKLLWQIIQNGYRGDPGEIMSPAAVVIRGDELFVLENIADEVSVFDLDTGKFLREYDLEELWGREPSYITSLTATGDGWLIEDSSTDKSLVYTDRDFKIKSTAKHRLADGREFRFFDDPIVMDDNSTWLLAEGLIVEVGDDGGVINEIGTDRSSGGFSSIDRIRAFGDALVLLSDQQTGIVYGFSPQGELLQKYVVGPEDFERSPPWTWFNVSDDGHVFIQSFKLEGNIRFSPVGERLGIEPERVSWMERDSSQAKEYAPLDKRPPGARWSGLGLLDAKGKEVFRIDRRPDERWADGGGYVAANKEIAVIQRSPGWEEQELTVSFYTDTGQPMSLAHGVFEKDFVMGYAYDGELVYFFHADGIIALDRDLTPVWRAQYPQELGETPLPAGFLSDGRLVVTLDNTVFVLKMPS